MSAPASPPSSSFRSHLLLPVLAVLTVLGVLFFGLRSGPEDASTAAKPAAPAAQAQARMPIATPAPAPVQTAPAEVTADNAPKTAPGLAQTSSPAPVVSATVVQAQLDGSAESLIDPPSAEQPLAPGEAARARVTVNGIRTPVLVPNQAGSFPRVYLPLGGQADVQVQLPEAAPGDQVVAAVEDGGKFADGKPVQVLTLDENRQVAFQFQASQSLGTFRVSVRHAAQTKIVTFWAGERTLAFGY